MQISIIGGIKNVSILPQGYGWANINEYASLGLSCNLGYGHDDWPFITSDGKAIVYSTQSFTGGDIVFMYLESDLDDLQGIISNDQIIEGEHSCIRITENGTNTYPVSTTFISN